MNGGRAKEGRGRGAGDTEEGRGGGEGRGERQCQDDAKWGVKRGGESAGTMLGHGIDATRPSLHTLGRSAPCKELCVASRSAPRSSPEVYKVVVRFARVVVGLHSLEIVASFPQNAGGEEGEVLFELSLESRVHQLGGRQSSGRAHAGRTALTRGKLAKPLTQHTTERCLGNCLRWD